MSKKVIQARTQTGVFVSNANVPGPQIGELGTVFPTTNKTLQELDMSAEDNGLLLKIVRNGAKASVLIPYANVVFMVLAD